MSETLQSTAGPADEVWNAEQSPGFLLWHLQNRWQRHQREALSGFGLTPVQFLLLAGCVAIDTESGPVSQVVLARRCRTDPMMTSQVVRALEKQGHLRRVRNSVDKRAYKVEPTEEGRRLVTSAMADVRRVEERFFAALGPDVPAFADAMRILGGERPRRRVQAVSRTS